MVAAGSLAVELDQDSRGTNYVGIATQKNLNDNKWHHVVITRASTTVSVYVDGALSNTGNTGGVTNLSNTKSFKLGQSYLDDPQFRLSATFDRVAIFNQALSANTVASYYSATA